MSDPIVKTAVVFRPKRNWKPKRRDRNIARRKKRRRWWRRNKNRLKIQRKQRRKQLRHNSMFKAWRKKRQREKHKRRMRFASFGETVFPESWFIFRDEAVDDIDLGYVVDYDPDTEELLVFDVDEQQEKVVNLDDFLTHSEFLEEADLDNFELIMDQYYGEDEDDLDLVDEDDEAPPEGLEGFEGFEILKVEMAEPMIKRVAQRWMHTKTAFNKENPADLLSQLVKVLDKASTRAPAPSRKRLRDISSRVKSMGRDVQDAWKRREEE
jgi:hypothetical protein